MVQIQILLNIYLSRAREHRTFVTLIICPVERFQCLDEYRTTSTFEQLAKFTRGWHVIRRTRWIIWYQRKMRTFSSGLFTLPRCKPLRSSTEHQRLNIFQILENKMGKMSFTYCVSQIVNDILPNPDWTRNAGLFILSAFAPEDANPSFNNIYLPCFHYTCICCHATNSRKLRKLWSRKPQF